MCANDITAEQRKTVLALLARHLPNTTAWVYGSRVKWTARPQSDLDLVVFATPEQAGRVSDLREAFEESNLPFRVDLFVWDTVPEQFRKTIEAEHVVLVEKEEQKTARDWHETTLGGLLSFANGKSSPRRSDGLPHAVYGSNGIIGFSDETNADPNTIVVGRVGTYCGSLHYSNRICWVTDNAIRSTAINRNDAKFLFYLLQTLRLNEWRAGSGQPLLNQTILSSIHVAVPDPTEQRAIAHILGTLDDKIELNRRMNQTLEEMARALFKSWFVGFDPVRAKATLKHHEATPPQGGSDWSVERARAYLDRMDPNIAAFFPDSFMDSELGLIPEGWEVGCFGDMVEQIRDKDHPLASPDAIFRHFSIPAFDENQWPKAERGENIKSQKSRVLPGVVLLSKLNPEIERVWMVDVDASDRAVCSTEFLVLRPRPPYGRSFAYCLGCSPAFRQELGSLVTGTSKSHQRVQADAVFALPVVLFPKPISEAFERKLSVVLQMTQASRRESRTLATLRDALLPKLMSGEVRVERV